MNYNIRGNFSFPSSGLEKREFKGGRFKVGRICLETTFCFCSCISCISWFKYFSRFIAVGLTKKNGFPLRLSEECCHSFSDVGKVSLVPACPAWDGG